MILNERQYAITKAQIKRFELAIAEEEKQGKSPPKNLNEQIRHQAYLDQLKSQLEELHEEIKEYEKLKENNIETLQCESFEQLPEALVKARIIRGLNQEQLAQLLNVKPQQVQRDEANKYASASFSKLLKVQKALNIEIQEKIIFK